MKDFDDEDYCVPFTNDKAGRALLVECLIYDGVDDQDARDMVAECDSAFLEENAIMSTYVYAVAEQISDRYE
jgi:hypothetical protein